MHVYCFLLGCSLLFIKMFIQKFIKMFIKMFIAVYWSLLMSIDVYWCSLMFIVVHCCLLRCLLLFIDIWDWLVHILKALFTISEASCMGTFHKERSCSNDRMAWWAATRPAIRCLPEELTIPMSNDQLEVLELGQWFKTVMHCNGHRNGCGQAALVENICMLWRDDHHDPTQG